MKMSNFGRNQSVCSQFMPEQLRSRSRGERFGAWAEDALQRYGSEALSAGSLVCTGLAAVPRIAGGPFLWLFLGVAFAVTAAVVRVKGGESVESMRTSRDEAKLLAEHSAQALRDAVRPLAFNLNEYLGLVASHQRLSVYCHFDGEFRLLARVAKNPLLQTPGRKVYPESQGVIGSVWRDGNAFERIGRQEEWNDWAKRFDFSQEEANGLRMKSKVIAAVRLDHQRESVGIVLVESENPRGITAAQFEDLERSYITRSLAEILSIAGPLIQEVP